MGFTYGKDELIGDIQELFAKHNVQAIHVKEEGTLFSIDPDGSFRIGVGATIVAFDRHPDDKTTFQVIDGGRKK
ncbi:hypothetical protein QRD89_06465 [Halobacillus sp. ACCC02827]|uniref:hypothetical protein n=1 Tax=unclassified Halobacillus TaxID=2636472 RepID=UPI0002A52288|nr:MULTISPECIES: hypothetical protein [unclassified Halobacillus]ELK45642.1 hypothetical protein D479_13912 [Halobacillus sp. BAB-2008]WJE16985.1 hypothetical protein QRD89_06465 [Halobacillus sp. ACCC02827]